MGNEIVRRYADLSIDDRVNILGVGISPISMEIAVSWVDECIAAGDHKYVCVTGVHGVMECQKDESLRSIHNRAGLVTPDGMPIVWLSRLRGYKQVERVYGPDLMLAISELSSLGGYRQFYYGGAEGIPERLSESLSSRFPGLEIVGTYSPPFRVLTEAEDAEVVEMINDSGADILWIGLSTPKQERWMAEHLGKIDAPVMIGVGAAFDFLSGRKPQAPAWIRRMGLEWSFRLANEPRRLWRRYLINNPSFLIKVLLQGLGITKYRI